MARSPSRRRRQQRPPLSLRRRQEVHRVAAVNRSIASPTTIASGFVDSEQTQPSHRFTIPHVHGGLSNRGSATRRFVKSRFCLLVSIEGVRNQDVGNTAKTGFIVDDDVIDEIEDVSDNEEELFDSLCSICDDGGELLRCEGRCMRSFHATVEAGSEFNCESLGLSDEQVEAMPNFVCKNCQYKQHQCFVCGILGSSDKLSGAQVFSCVSATCGRFYHPRCVAKLLHRENAVEAEELQKKIADGESFTCPIHKCFLCKQGEDKTDHDLQFAVCRRCPKSFHRKCLPRRIGLEDDEDNGITQRAWEYLIPNRILMYCLKHEMGVEIGTPVRNHIKFPDDGREQTDGYMCKQFNAALKLGYESNGDTKH